MRNTLAFAIAVVLLLISSLPQGSVCASPIHHEGAQKGRIDLEDDSRNRADRFITEVRSGYATELRARQLRLKNKPLARAMKDLENRGLKPAFDRGFSILAIDKENVFKKTAAQTVVEGDYELTFMPYENGNENTWEGLIYFVGGGNSDVDYALLDVSSEETVYVLAEQNYSNNGSGGGGGGGEFETRNRLNNYSPLVTRASYATATGPLGRILVFVACFVSYCIRAMYYCRSTGPFWAQCSLVGCAASAIVCALNALK